MAQLQSTESPLWRAGFYHCTHLVRLRVNNSDALARRKEEVDKMLKDHGLKLIGQGVIRYSKHGMHGYTYMTGLLQSGAMIHTYPDRRYRSATFMLESCEPEKAMLKILCETLENLRWFWGAESVLFRTGAKPLPLRSCDVPIGKIEIPKLRKLELRIAA
ncbi:MAG: hypothetical protein Q7R54_00390 [bacterium]|nr:hypothetical protein [bacterium]